MALLVLFTCLIFAVLGQQEPVLVVIGDSWGSFGFQVLQKVLTAHGSNLKVVSYAIGGTSYIYDLFLILLYITNTIRNNVNLLGSRSKFSEYVGIRKPHSKICVGLNWRQRCD